MPVLSSIETSQLILRVKNQEKVKALLRGLDVGNEAQYTESLNT